MISRNDSSLIGRWWRTTDFFLMGVFLTLIVIGIFIMISASPVTSSKVGLVENVYVFRYTTLSIIAILLMIFFSFLEIITLKKICFYLILPLSMLGMLYLGISNYQLKGANRWLSFFGYSLQVSEFLKPSLAIVFAHLLAHQITSPNFPGKIISIFICSFVLVLMFFQPDLGQSFIVFAIFFSQFFVLGLPLKFLIGLMIIFPMLIILAFFSFPHVEQRLLSFFYPAKYDTYQVDKSIDAILSGGLFGKGFGGGEIKYQIPDISTDFIFAFIGEEFGILFCIFIIIIYLTIIIRSLVRAYFSNDTFIMLATTGIITYLSLQILINIGSSLRLIPAKGTTLPFLSYGGSSLIASALSAGFLLIMLRKNLWLKKTNLKYG